MVFILGAVVSALLLIPSAAAWPNPEAKEIIAKRDTVIRRSIKYVACNNINPRMVDIIQGHIQDVEKLAAEAYKQAQKGNRYFDAFFGTTPNNRHELNDATMKERFRVLSNIQGTKNARSPDGWFTLRCDYAYAPDNRCRGFGAPMMTEVSTGTIWACASFFLGMKRLQAISPPTPRMGLRALDEYSPTGGLILHEFTHSIWLTMDKKINNGEVMYGHKKSLQGVKERGFTKGRINADNYRMFATAAYWSATRGTSWAVRPEDVNDQDL